MGTAHFYIGTYTQPILFGTGDIFQGKGEGIYRLSMNTETGEISLEGAPAPADNPSYLCFSPDKKYLYAVNELKEFEGQSCGAVSAFSIDEGTGALTYLNSRPTGGTDPCHVNMNNEQTHVYVSNFMSGSVCVFPVSDDGHLEEASQFIQHEGSSVISARQKGPHAHSLAFDRTQSYAFVPDLGIDKLMVYKTDFSKGTLTPADTPFYQTFPGSGPRHCEFHPNYRFCYLINEIASSISLLYYDEESGSFSLKQTISTIPDDYEGNNICADLHLTPDGKYLYGSNRGHNSLAAFSVNQETGELTLLDTVPCGGEVPRNFCIDKDGHFLLVGNQDTDNITVFSICGETGKLTQVYDLSVPSPVCIRQFS